MVRFPLLLAVLAAVLAGPSALAQSVPTRASDGADDGTRYQGPEGHIRVSWDAGPVGSVYSVLRQRLDTGGAPQVVALVPETDSTYLDTATLPGVAYEYCVFPGAVGASDANCDTGSRILRRPRTVRAGDSTRVDGVALEWADLSSVETGYVIFRGATGDPQTVAALTPVDTTTADATAALDLTAEPLVAYRYCVGMLHRSGGVVAVAEPLACDLGTRAAVLPPAGVAATDGALADRVRVAWSTRTGITYSVYRSAPGTVRQSLVSSLATGLYDDLTAAEGTVYTYCVTASNADGESVAACDTGQRGGLAPPTAVAASDGASDSRVEITWADPGPSESGFRVYRQQAGAADERVTTLPANRTRYADISAGYDIPYTYCVVAIAEATVDGASVVSESARACDAGTMAGILGATLQASQADASHEGYVDLTWETPSDVVQVFRIGRSLGGGTVEFLATLPPFARSFRDETGMAGTDYEYRVVSYTLRGVDPSAITQGIGPALERASAERLALAADREQAREQSPEAVARVDEQVAAVELALVRDIEAIASGLGVDSGFLTADASAQADVLVHESDPVVGSRIVNAPTSLTVDASNEDRLVVTWVDRSQVEVTYEIQRTYTGFPGATGVESIGPNRTEWIDTVSPAGVDVVYRIRALDRDPATAASASEWVEVAARRTLLPPGNVTASQAGQEDELLVTWRDSSRAETGYTVTAALASGMWTGQADANARQLAVPLQPADIGTALAITVRAVDGKDTSGIISGSAVVSAIAQPTLLAPRVFTASTGYPDRVVLSWTDDSRANTSYRVTRNGTTVATLGDVMTWVDSNPVGTATYCVIPFRSGATGLATPPVCADGRTSQLVIASTGANVSAPRSASGLEGNALYGSRLAAHEGQAAVGAPNDAVTGRPPWARAFTPSQPRNGGYAPDSFLGAGLASIFERDASGWEDVARLQISTESPFTYSRFGADVDVRGDVAIIGAPGSASFITHPTQPSDGTFFQYDVLYSDGGAYIYERTPQDTWVRTRLLRANNFPDNQYSNLNLYSDPDTRPNGFPFGNSAPSRIVTREYNQFNLVDTITSNISPGVQRFGERVALSTSWAFATYYDGTSAIGYIRTFRRSGGGWADTGFIQRNYIDPQIATSDDLLVVGIPFASSGRSLGTVELFALSPSGIGNAVQLARPDGFTANAQYGRALDVEGDLLVVGAPGDNAVAISRRTGANLTFFRFEARLEPEAGDTEFGRSVAISGETIIIGARGEDPSSETTGVAYVFTFVDGAWTQTARVYPSTGQTAGTFGAAVAASGDDILIGAPLARPGSSPTGAVFFATIGIDPDGVDASDGTYANRVQIRWNDRAESEDGHRVYRQGPDDLTHVLVGTVSANVEVYDDFDIAPGAAYSYCVASFLGNDETNTNPLGESGRVCDIGYTPANGTISGRLATTEGGNVAGSGVCLEPGPDRAIVFDGQGGRARVDNFGAMPASFTIEAWVNGNDYLGSTGVQTIAGIEEDGFALLQVGYLGVARPQFVVSADGQMLEAEAGPDIGPGWHHIVGAYDHTTSTAVLYIDGQTASSRFLPGTPTTPADAQGTFLIGQGTYRRGQTPQNQFFDGRIDDISVWGRALTLAEVRGRFEQSFQGSEDDRFAHWAMEQGSGRILTDLTEGGRHATLLGGAEWTDEAAPIGGCTLTDTDGNYTFDGIRYGNSTAFRVVPTDPTRQFTPEAKTVTLTPESPTENQLDFTDTSSYTVRGRVVHAVDPRWDTAPSTLPAPGIDLYVDGTLAGTTESDGTFALAVRGSRQHVFEARTDSLALVFTARYDGQDFADGTAEITTTGDVDGILFTNTTQRQLRGRAAGGCERPIGNLQFRVYTEDRLFDQIVTTAGPAAYDLSLPPLEYRLEYVGLGDVPGTLDRTEVIDYFDNLGVLRADLTTEADTVDFRYRAPITLVVEGLSAPSATCAVSGYTVVDADGNARQTLPNVPVIAEYDRIPLVIRAYEDYGDGGLCVVDEGTVQIFDGFADTASDPVEVALADGEARYITFGRSPDTFSGRTVGGVDRSYQKSLTAVLEVPDGPSVTETVWAFVEGYREKPSTFVTATMSEIPVMILRDPPGTESFAYVEEETQTCTTLSEINTFASAGGIATDFKLGLKASLGAFVIIDTGAAFSLQTTTLLGGGVTQTTGPPTSNMQVCATTTERWETRGDTGWSGEDLYAGVGLNLIFAEADVVLTDAAACTVTLSTALATDFDEADPFATTFVYGTTHIGSTLIPRLESLARLAGDDAEIGAEETGQAPASVTLRRAIENWQGMLAFNDSLTTVALADEVDNRSFSGGSTYSFGTVADTTLTSSIERKVTFSTDVRFGQLFTLGYENSILGVAQIETESTFGRDSTAAETHSVGYTLSDSDAGDYFSVDVARDPRYGTYVFETLSGASSNPWESNTQKRDLPRLAIDPPIVDGVLDGESALFTLSLTNASESGERREYIVDAPPHLNADGSVVWINGVVLEEKRYLVEANQTISIPLRVERGPLADTSHVAIIAYSPFDHEIWRTAPVFDLVTSDTVRFEARFTPLVAPVRLVEPEDGWAVTLDARTVTLTLGDIDIEGLAQEQVGVEFRRSGGAWDTALSVAGDQLTGASETLDWTPPVALADGAYELRAFARRSGQSEVPPYYGPPTPGWIDRTAPLPFGAPEPADRVLALGETISLTFEEPIDCTSFRQGLVDASAEIVLEWPTGSVVPSVGCADRTILIAPADVSTWDLLEGHLATARVRGVRDLAGNPMAPLDGATAGWDAEWAFTVRRNAFGWTPAVVAVNAQPDVPTELPAALVNGRGQPVDFDLIPHHTDGLPFAFARLDAAGAPTAETIRVTTSALAGTVVSGDVQPVVFRWPGAAVGRYRAEIEVNSQENGDALGRSALTVTVEVACQAPAWQVNPAAFETSMPITARLTFPGGVSTDADDRLAAFVDGEVRGAAAVDGGLVSLVVYGTGPAERVTFQAWDQSDCTQHRTTSQVVEYVAGAALGTPSAPFDISAPGASGAPLEVPLAEGWTWVSTNREGTETLAAALVGVGTDPADLIQGQAAFAQYTTDAGWVGSLTGMTPGRGYHVRLAAPAVLTHPGALVAPTPLDLVAGWNWIGYLPAQPVALDAALASVTFASDDLVKSQTGYAQYVEGVGWIGSLQTLAPGLGYQLHVQEDATLTYPASAPRRAAAALQARPIRRMDAVPEILDVPAREHPASLVAAPKPIATPTPSASRTGGAAVPFQHSMVVTAAPDAAPDGAHLAAYAVTDNGEVLRALAPIERVEALGGDRAFLLVPGEEGETFVLRLVTASDGGWESLGDVVLDSGALAFERDAVLGTASDPMAAVLAGTAVEGQDLPAEVALAPARPNPVTGRATFDVALPAASTVRLVVYDVLGREVARLADGDLASGTHAIGFDSRALAAGTYVARLTVGADVRVRTFTVVR